MAPVADTPATGTTADDAATRALLLPRQATVTVVPLGGDVVTTTSGSTLSGGAIAGIVIGSVVGLVLLCWIVRCALIRQTSQGYEEEKGRRPRSQSYYTQEIAVDDGCARRSRSRHHSRHGHGHHHHSVGPHHHHHHRHSHSRGRGSRSRSAVRVTSTTTAQMPPVVEPTRVYYGEKRQRSRRRSSSHHDY